MSIFKKYPSIGKFQDVMCYVKKRNKRTFSHLNIDDNGNKYPVFNDTVLPILKFEGTVKLHGTNACVVVNSDETIDAQSRSRILTLISDNHGFCMWLSKTKNIFLNEYKKYINDMNIKSLHIYGEWCGSNIQSNVALTGIEKTFVIFSILQTNSDDSETWLSHDELNYLCNIKNNIRNIYEFKTYNVEIDMNNPFSGFEKIDQFKDEIDKICPVAKSLNSTAECTNGEGNVWHCITKNYEHLYFKHKGESHQRSGKKPKLQKIQEKLTAQQQECFDNFITTAVTVDRLAQGIEYLVEQNLEINQKNTGCYLKWFMSDVQKECETEFTLLSEQNISWSQIQKPITNMAREFLFSEINCLH